MSETLTLTENNHVKNEKSNILILRLKCNINNKKTVSWDEKIIDNEFLNKKKKNCCFYCKKYNCN
jgi:hypothetical protein